MKLKRPSWGIITICGIFVLAIIFGHFHIHPIRDISKYIGLISGTHVQCTDPRGRMMAVGRGKLGGTATRPTVLWDDGRTTYPPTSWTCIEILNEY